MWRENLVLLLTMLFLFHRQQINSDIMFFTIQFLFHSSPISFLFSLLFFFPSSRFPPIYKSSPHFSFLYVRLSPSEYSEQYSEPTGRKQSTVSSLILSEMKIETLKKALLKAPHLNDIQIWWQSTKACPCSNSSSQQEYILLLWSSWVLLSMSVTACFWDLPIKWVQMKFFVCC